MSELEEIFDGNAKKIMVNWDIDNFKKSHKMLFKVIMESMKQIQSRPTCGKEQRKFLDEIEKEWTFNGPTLIRLGDITKRMDFHGINSMYTIVQEPFKAKLGKVIKGE